MTISPEFQSSSEPDKSNPRIDRLEHIFTGLAFIAAAGEALAGHFRNARSELQSDSVSRKTRVLKATLPVAHSVVALHQFSTDMKGIRKQPETGLAPAEQISLPDQAQQVI